MDKTLSRLINWTLEQGLSTGHADDIDMLLDELLPQLEEIRELARQEQMEKDAKGERMPQTPKQFALMAEKYEKALFREKEENSQLRAKLNKSKQKYQKVQKAYEQALNEVGRE